MIARADRFSKQSYKLHWKTDSIDSTLAPYQKNEKKRKNTETEYENPDIYYFNL